MFWRTFHISICEVISFFKQLCNTPLCEYFLVHINEYVGYLQTLDITRNATVNFHVRMPFRTCTNTYKE